MGLLIILHHARRKTPQARHDHSNTWNVQSDLLNVETSGEEKTLHKEFASYFSRST